MCIIIYRPKGAASRISRETMRHCAMENPHGFGLMWQHAGKVHTARYLWKDLKQFFDRTLALQNQDVPFVAHFRYMTHGAERLDNCHPFWIKRSQSALMHNGILNIDCVKGWSDTRTFVGNVLKQLPENWDAMPALWWAIYEATVGSKLVVMRPDSVLIVHEKSGVWDGGIWYSNEGYKKRPYILGVPQDNWRAEFAEWKRTGEWPRAKPLARTATQIALSAMDREVYGLDETRTDAAATLLAAQIQQEEQEERRKDHEALKEALKQTATPFYTGCAFNLTSANTSPSSNPAEVAFEKRERLYMFEGLVICESCAATDLTGKDRDRCMLLLDSDPSDSCEICHTQALPVSKTGFQLTRIK